MEENHVNAFLLGTCTMMYLVLLAQYLFLVLGTNTPTFFRKYCKLC